MAGTQEEFDRILEVCLGRLESGEATLETLLVEHPDQAAELRPLLETAAWLQTKSASLAPRPEFVSASRQHLVTRLQQEQVATTGLAARAPKASLLRRTRRWLVSASQPLNRNLLLQFATALVLFIAVVSGGIGTAFASQQALPGDVLYPVKISLEQAELFFSTDAENDARLHLQFAQLRSHEMQDLVALNRYLYLRDTLANYQYHINDAIRLVAEVASLSPDRARALALHAYKVIMEQPAILERLAQSVPERVFPGLATAVQVANGWRQAIESILADLEIESTPTPSVKEALPTVTNTATQTPSPTGNTSLDPLSITNGTSTPVPTATQTATTGSIPVSTSTSTPKAGSTQSRSQATRTATATTVTQTRTPTATVPAPTATRTLPPTLTSTSPPTSTATSLPPPTSTATLPPPPPTSTATLPPPTPTATTPPYPF
ncbi:MAG TPA: DUF5667 domain-containing protein [Anaerolineales bacterium]|nr:DUF5667 domain-containing protein [Anaerolineales bacterium]